MREEDDVAPAGDEVIELAFVLPEESGVDLLLRLGTLDVWRGDLAAMRNDAPRAAAEDSGPPPVDNTTRAERLYAALAMKKGLAYLQPRCLETLRLRYLEGRDVEAIARELETTTRYAEKLIANCRRRVYEIVDSIQAAQDNGRPPAEPREDELSAPRPAKISAHKVVR